MKTKTDIQDRFVIIMAGGRGERFWPLSREKTPKQLLAILGKKSFLQEAVEQLLGRLLAAQRPETLAASAGHDDDEPVFDVSLGFHNFFLATD